MSSLRHSRAMRVALLIFSGALTGLTLIFPKLGFLQWISIVPMAVVLFDALRRTNTSMMRIWSYGLAYFASYYLVVYHWFLGLPSLEFTGLGGTATILVMLLGWLGVSLLQSILGAFMIMAVAFIAKSRLAECCAWLKPITAGALWCIFEWSQTFFWTGVPWGRLPIGQSECLPMLRSSAFLGSYFVTFIIVAINFGIALMITERDKIKLCTALVSSLMAFNLLLGSIAGLVYDNGGDDYSVAVIQGNIVSGEKWDMPVQDILDVYIEQSFLVAQQGVDLIVWPETTVPITPDGNPNQASRIRSAAVMCEADILVGMFTRNDEETLQNSLVLFKRDGSVSEDTYSKRRLVPFGEYVPMRGLFEALIPPLTEVAMLEDDIARGTDSGLIDWNGTSLGSLICFDSIYESETLESVRDGAELLILCTNDSWFDGTAAMNMHLAQAKMRAVESGRYVVRAANTGISAIIDGQGRTVDELEPMTRGAMVCRVGTTSRVTLYGHVGNMWIYIAMLFVFVMGIGSCCKKSQKND